MFDGDMKYEAYLAEWLKGKRYSVSARTLKDDEFWARTQIVPLLGHLTLLQLTPMVLQSFVNTLTDKGFSSSTVKRIFNVLRSSLAAAEKMQLVPRNNATVISRPKIRRKELQVWNIDQVRRFLEVASHHQLAYIAFHLALLTGMRQGEILGLRWRDVDFEGKLIYVTQTLSHDGKEFLSGAKTASGIRSVAMAPETVKALMNHHKVIEENKTKYPEQYHDHDLVVCTRFGAPFHPANLTSVWHKLLQESGLPKIRFHDLRHTHASLLLRNNVHPKIVSERLGHSSVRVTLDTYSHLLPNLQRDAAEKLGALILSDPTTG